MLERKKNLAANLVRLPTRKLIVLCLQCGQIYPNISDAFKYFMKATDYKSRNFDWLL